MKVIRYVLLLILSGFAFRYQDTGLKYLVNEPSIKEKRPPVLVILHGYGANEEDLFELSRGFDGRFKTFCPRAPQVLQEGSYAWYKLERNGRGGFSYDYKQVKDIREKLFKWIASTCREQELDSNRVFILGFSQGAMLAYDMALSHPSGIKGILALSGKLLPESRPLKPGPDALKKLAVFIGHGDQDLLIPQAEAEQAEQYLKGLAITNLQRKSYKMAHSINGQELVDMRQWLTRNLDAASPRIPEKTKAR